MRVQHGGLQKGYYWHPLYQTWARMLRRCYDDKCSDYYRYGARGIFVCERWMNIENFISDMSPRPLGCTLDRINNDGEYSPNNCRWATRKQQNRNNSNCKLTEDDVEKIKVLRLAGTSYRTLGRLFEVDHSTIYAIFAKKSWRQ